MDAPETTELPETPKRKPVAKRRAVRKAARPRKPPAEAAPATDDGMAGLTATDCCEGCYAAGKCVITGSICGHPYKGGLQPALQMQPDVMRRYNAAKRKIAHLKVELRG